MLATIQWARRGMGEYAPKSLLGHMCMCISAYFACTNNDIYQPTFNILIIRQPFVKV